MDETVQQGVAAPPAQEVQQQQPVPPAISAEDQKKIEEFDRLNGYLTSQDPAERQWAIEELASRAQVDLAQFSGQKLPEPPPTTGPAVDTNAPPEWDAYDPVKQKAYTDWQIARGIETGISQAKQQEINARATAESRYRAAIPALKAQYPDLYDKFADELEAAKNMLAPEIAANLNLDGWQTMAQIAIGKAAIKGKLNPPAQEQTQQQIVPQQQQVTNPVTGYGNFEPVGSPTQTVTQQQQDQLDGEERQVAMQMGWVKPDGSPDVEKYRKFQSSTRVTG